MLISGQLLDKAFLLVLDHYVAHTGIGPFVISRFL